MAQRRGHQLATAAKLRDVRRRRIWIFLERCQVLIYGFERRSHYPAKHCCHDEILVWDTTSVPNGRYTVRIVASDLPANSSADALSGARESAAFAIDNVPPVITVTAVRRDNGRATIAFDVSDANSSVQKVDFSLDGDKWQSVYPKDGIADSRFEQFELVLEGDAVARGVTLRATDALNNTASARGEMPEPAASGRR